MLPLPPAASGPGREFARAARARPRGAAGMGREHVLSCGAGDPAMVRRTDENVKLVLENEWPIALYDLAAGPGERIDLLGECGDLAAEFQATFLEWRALRGSGAVAEELTRTDAEALERLRRPGYTEGDVGH